MTESESRRANLFSQISDLRELQRQSLATATFGGWTTEETAIHDKRADQLTRLIHEVDVLERNRKLQRVEGKLLAGH